MTTSKRFLARKAGPGEWGVWDSKRKTFVGITFTQKHAATKAAKTRNEGETLSKARGPYQRDPETKRAVRRLELELHETRDIKRAVAILHKLLALYQELGDASGVMKCKQDLKRAEAISARHEERKRRRGHRVSTSRRHHSRRGRSFPHNGDIIDLAKSILWHKDDLSLIELPNGVCLLIQEKPLGPVVRKKFRTSQDAVAYLLEKYGPLFFKSNDPEGRRKNRRRSK